MVVGEEGPWRRDRQRPEPHGGGGGDPVSMPCLIREQQGSQQGMSTEVRGGRKPEFQPQRLEGPPAQQGSEQEPPGPISA